MPHPANQTMVTSIAQAAGLAPEQLYFDIACVGNTFSAPIPIAVHVAVRDGVITGQMRLFAPRLRGERRRRVP